MFQEDSNNQTVNILASVSFFLKMDPFRQWHQRRFCCKFLLTGLITLNSWQNLANVDVMVTQEARLCNTYEECENLTFGSGKHVLGCFVPMMLFEQKDHKILENCLFAKTNPLWLPGWRLPQSLWCVQGSGSIVAFQVHAPLYSKVMQALWYVQGRQALWCGRSLQVSRLSL